MTEKVKTVIQFFFLLPDFKSRGNPSQGFGPIMVGDPWVTPWVSNLIPKKPKSSNSEKKTYGHLIWNQK